MANITNGLDFYSSNVVRSLKNWNLLSNAVYQDNEILIKPGGSAGVLLTDDYNSGLNASAYRKLTTTIDMELNPQYSYQNLVEVLIRGIYVDNQGNRTVCQYYIPANFVKGDSGQITFTRLIQMENLALESCAVYVLNHSQYAVYLKDMIMLRSQDISSNQVGSSIGWGITLNKVVAYLDGCEIYFDGMQTPDKLWWQEDEQGNFSGINVNNERLISFSRKNEILLD